jgi:hypothetical protein
MVFILFSHSNAARSPSIPVCTHPELCVVEPFQAVDSDITISLRTLVQLQDGQYCPDGTSRIKLIHSELDGFVTDVAFAKWSFSVVRSSRSLSEVFGKRRLSTIACFHVFPWIPIAVPSCVALPWSSYEITGTDAGVMHPLQQFKV